MAGWIAQRCTQKPKSRCAISACTSAQASYQKNTDPSMTAAINTMLSVTPIAQDTSPKTERPLTSEVPKSRWAHSPPMFRTEPEAAD